MLTAAPDPATEDALIPLSALQHQLFCPRQCALIHVEGLWAEDSATAAGRVLHERVDGGKPDRRPGVRIVRAMAIRSLALGVAGKADVVELHGTPPRPYPVEYKRGRPKAHRADEVQLAAQAIALEEMFAVTIPEGALYYGTTRRRTVVAIDRELRALTASVAADTKAMIAAGCTPPPIYDPARCDRCSMIDLCQPRRLQRPPGVAAWLARELAAESVPL